ncbi:MAG: GNAT family N-acetyltransferase [Nostoc sp.]|uniref:GNAT family N-acetyltransferase n=1 Tax=Nostoc sp. TaxID=1180 RepID=UPI002FFBF0DC
MSQPTGFRLRSTLSRRELSAVETRFTDFIFTQVPKGYATEAGRVMLNYGFSILNLPVIYAVVKPENYASIRTINY